MKIPTSLLRGLNPEELRVVREWWTALSPEAQAQVKAQCNERSRPSASAMAGKPQKSRGKPAETSQPLSCTQEAKWQRLGFQLEGILVEGDEPYDNWEWNEDLYEFMVNHEFELLDDGRTFHICHAHPAPIAAARSGKFPTGFTCPFNQADCLMRAVLDQYPGRAIVLRRKIIAPTKPNKAT